MQVAKGDIVQEVLRDGIAAGQRNSLLSAVQGINTEGDGCL